MNSRGLGARDQALDVVRGGCVLMMTFAHLAPLTIVNRLLHLPLWVDGASGFVLLSGLVLGMVQHGRLRRGGMRGAQRALLGRALLLYVWHVGIVLLAVLLGSLTAVRAPWLPDAEDHGGPVGVLVRTLLLRLNLPYLDILSLYVVLFAFAVLAVWLLARGRLLVLVAVSLAVYVLAQFLPRLLTLGAATGTPSQFTWGAWQLLFVSGLVAGWHWRSHDLAARLTSWRTVLAAIAVAAAIYAACLPVVYLGVAPALHDAAAAFVAKGTAGPGAIALGWVAVVVAYALVRRGLRRFDVRWFAVLSTIGRRSLDSYVLLTILVVTVPALSGRVITGTASVALAVVAVAAMCGWVWVRDRMADAGSRRWLAFPVDVRRPHGRHTRSVLETGD